MSELARISDVLIMTFIIDELAERRLVFLCIRILNNNEHLGDGGLANQQRAHTIEHSNATCLDDQSSTLHMRCIM